ncbi:hypothetical protein, partial [Pantoea sp.]|uniref:hypothetical protein n=1 Tax=Pantoea sp. TaxID=69393 RepID=UPI0031E2DD14
QESPEREFRAFLRLQKSVMGILQSAIVHILSNHFTSLHFTSLHFPRRNLDNCLTQSFPPHNATAMPAETACLHLPRTLPCALADRREQ